MNPVGIKYKIFLFFQSKVWYLYFLKIIGKLTPGKIELLEGKSELCSGGYGGSGTGFISNILAVTNNDLNFTSHCHFVAVIKLALKRKMPTIVNLRDPENAVPSVIIRHRNRYITHELNRYIAFYSFVRENKDRILVLPFEDLVKKTDKCLDKIVSFTGYSFHYPDIEEVKEKVEKRVEKRTSGRQEYNVPLPSNERDEMKRRLMEETKVHPLFEKADRLYKELREEFRCK